MKNSFPWREQNHWIHVTSADPSDDTGRVLGVRFRVSGCDHADRVATMARCPTPRVRTVNLMRNHIQSKTPVCAISRA